MAASTQNSTSVTTSDLRAAAGKIDVPKEGIKLVADGIACGYNYCQPSYGGASYKCMDFAVRSTAGEYYYFTDTTATCTPEYYYATVGDCSGTPTSTTGNCVGIKHLYTDP